MMRASGGLLLLGFAAAALAADREPPRNAEQTPAAATIGSVLVVEVTGESRTDVLASALLTGSDDQLRTVRLVEITQGPPRAVRAQLEPSRPARLWWLVEGELHPGSPRLFRVQRSAEAEAEEQAKDEALSQVSVERRPEALVVRIGKSPVLQYNVQHVEPPAGIDARYGRSAFLHPLWTPSGAVVTDQFPPDHAHQSGVFLAHTKTEFEGRTPNYWDLLGGTGHVRCKSVSDTVEGPLFGELRVEQEHVDLTVPGGKVALAETWDVRVWNASSPATPYRLVDVTSTLRCATDEPVKLLEYHYGGFALRGAREWTADRARVITSEGLDRIAGNHTRPRWCDLAGPVGEQWAGIALLTHPGNFRSPEPLRIHPTMPYMVYSPSHLGDWEITPGTPHVSRYLLVVHDGELAAPTAERIWKNFAQPLAARVREP